MKIYLSLLVTFLSATLFSPSMSEDSSCKASDLKAHAKIKEKEDGYVEAIQIDDNTTSCVEQINIKRRDKYQDIANKKKVSIAEVGIEAAEKIKKKDTKR